MIELPLVFVAGFLGSSHCIGMCGPFAILLGSGTSRWAKRLSVQLLFSLGRIFTYAMLGATAGYAGIRLADASSLISVPAILSLLAGGFLVYLGLSTAGVLATGWSSAGGPCLVGGLLSSVVQRKDNVSIFLAGLFTGFLPCGLVYGLLGIAGSSRSLASGALIMAVFGAGTVPVMIATGLGGGMLTATTRTRVTRVAAWCIVFAGAMSILRGVSYIGVSDFTRPEVCPLCP